MPTTVTAGQHVVPSRALARCRATANRARFSFATLWVSMTLSLVGKAETPPPGARPAPSASAAPPPAASAWRRGPEAPRPSASLFAGKRERLGISSRGGRRCLNDDAILNANGCALPAYANDACLARVIPDWKPWEVIPPGYEPRVQYRTGILGGSAALLGASWALTTLGAALSYASDPGSDRIPLFIPVAGPYVEMVHYQRGNPLALFGSALFQSGAVVGLVWGLVDRRTELVRSSAGRSHGWSSWRLLPFAAGTASSLGVEGAF
ncbi:MAG: hypothetical protein AAF715_01525 [Myxococcota bacterium]